MTTQLVGKANILIPNQIPTCLTFLAISLPTRHFVVGSTSLEDAKGCLTLFEVSNHGDEITLIQSLPTPSGITALHASASRIATGTIDGQVRTYDILQQNNDTPTSLCLIQEHSFFPSSTEITSIQYHPLLLSNLICTTNHGDVRLVKLPRSKLEPVEASITDETFFISHNPSTAWAAAWTPLPRKGDVQPLGQGQGTYTVGDDNKIQSSTWTLTDNFRHDEYPDHALSPEGIHEGMGITGVVNLMLPGLMEGRNILATTGRDGSVNIINSFTNVNDDALPLEGGLIAAFKMNERGGVWGLKVLGKPYIPDEGLEDEQDEADREIEKIYEKAQEAIVSEARDNDETKQNEEVKDSEDTIRKVDEIVKEEVDDAEVTKDKIPAKDPTKTYCNALSCPGHGPRSPEVGDEYGESTMRPPWIKTRWYTLLVGDPKDGPTLLEIEIEGTTDRKKRWKGRKWNFRKIAVFGEHKGEEALISDGYLQGNTVVGVSASRETDNGGTSGKVSFWEYKLD